MSRYIGTPSSTRGVRLGIPTRVLRATLGLAVLAGLGIVSTRADAQTPDSGGTFEIRPVVGAFVPTGDHRDLLKDAALMGLQLGYSINPSVALVGSFGWSPSKDKFRTVQNKVDAFQYDLGIEGRLNGLTSSGSFAARPYLAVGIGGRTYDYRDIKSMKKETNFLGYGAVGLDLDQRAGPLGFRLEARDNITSFKGMQGELSKRKGRNDIQFTIGLTYRI